MGKINLIKNVKLTSEIPSKTVTFQILKSGTIMIVYSVLQQNNYIEILKNDVQISKNAGYGYDSVSTSVITQVEIGDILKFDAPIVINNKELSIVILEV